MGPIPEWGRSPGGGHGSPLQHSCLENPMDRGAWWAAVHRVAKSRTAVSNSHTRTQDAGVKADKWNQRSKQTRRNCPLTHDKVAPHCRQGLFKSKMCMLIGSVWERVNFLPFPHFM